jgi:hypothetical protein
MALVINDRVKETTTTTGTGAVSLGGAVTGFETFAAGVGNSNTTYYAIVHQTANEFEVGLGTLDGDSSDLTRTTVISSSNSDSAVDFAAGTKDVFCTIPASKLIFEDSNNDVTIGRNLTVTGDLTITGDDITMNTNTSGAALIGDGSNFNPVAISGDISIGSDGTAAIGSGVIVNADINSSAAIADSKLATISTADKVAGGAIQIDSGTDGTSITLADTDKFLVDDGGTTKYINASQLNSYTSGSVAADNIATGDAAVTLATSSGDITIDAQAGDADIIFKGTDSSSDITALTLDMSEAGAATFNDKIVATELDISGNIDIDGTSNLDAVDIDGAVQLDATLTVGADDQGYDVKLFGDTASAYMLWDTSADDLILGGAAGLIVPDGKLTLGSTAVTSTAAELNLLDGVSGLVQADLTKLAAVDSTAAELNIVDGGTAASSITLADADRLVTNDDGTMKQVALSTLKTYLTSAGFSSEDPTALAIALG